MIRRKISLQSLTRGADSKNIKQVEVYKMMISCTQYND